MFEGLRRLFSAPAAFPDDVRTELDAEGLALLEEGLPGSITWRHYRAPGRRYGWRKLRTRGSVAVTSSRVIVWAAGHRQVDVQFSDGSHMAALEVSVEKPGVLLFAADAAAFHSDTSGRIEWRLRTPSAERVVELVGARR